MDIVDKIFSTLEEAEKSLKRAQKNIIRIENAIGELIEVQAKQVEMFIAKN